MPNSTVILEVSTEGVWCEVFANDIPLARVYPGTPPVVLQCNHLTVDGRNEFEVLIAPETTPSTRRTRKGSWPREILSISVRCDLCPPGKEPDDTGSRLLFRRQIPGTEGGDTLELPYSLRIAADLSASLGPWTWERAARLQLNDSLRGDVLQIIQGFHAALTRKSFDDFWAFNEITHFEIAKAYDIPYQERRARAMEALRERFTSPSFAMAPIDQGSFDLRLVGGGRLIDCVDHNGDAVVRTMPDSGGRVIRFPIMLGLVDGKLRGLR